MYDCLTEIREETEIRVLQSAALERNLGKYNRLLLKVLQNASKNNTYIRIKIIEEQKEDNDFY